MATLAYLLGFATATVVFWRGRRSLVRDRDDARDLAEWRGAMLNKRAKSNGKNHTLMKGG